MAGGGKSKIIPSCFQLSHTTFILKCVTVCVQVAAEYCKDTTLLLMGVICLAASIEKWNLHKRIALRMVMIAGAKPGM